MILNVKRTNPYAILPRYATPGAAGMDLSACLDEAIVLGPGQRAVVSTGLSVAVPPLHVGLVFARSGLAVKQGVTLSNGVGVIDSDYRGEIKVGLVNLGDAACTIQHGERVAQLAVMPVVHAQAVEVDELDDTARGTGGFGSTGK